MTLSVKDLARRASACLERAATLEDPDIVEEDARAVLQRLVNDRLVRLRHRAAIRVIKRALAVNMDDPRNRKGELPRALGLVGRALRQTVREHRAIVLMVNDLQDYCDKNGNFPYRRRAQAAQAVADGFHAAGINRDLTAANVEKIWQRSWARVRTRR